MARALDAGSGDAFTGRTSELRGKEKDPQPDRVGFKQVMSSLGVEDALANGLETTKTTPTGKDLLDEPDMPTITIPCYLYDLLFGSRPKAYMARTSIQMKINRTSVQTLEHLFVLRVPLKIQQMWLKN